MPLTDLTLAELVDFRPEFEEPDDFDAFWSATLAEARPSLGPSRESSAPTGNVARTADPVSFLTSSQGASDLKAEIGEVRRARATDSSPECNAPAPAGA